MQLAVEQPWSSALQIGPRKRVASIDILRGLTMLVMIFVNDLAGVQGLPWWNYHMGRVNGMTYVDMVFPFFLFWVGMSMPLAIESRLRKGSVARLWKHVLARTLSLLVLGVALANVDRADARSMGLGANAWGALMLLGAVLFWNVYPRDSRRRWLFRGLRALGLVLMVALFAIFRRVTRTGDVRWLSFGYWEILGLIGWTYLAVCILYIPTRRWRWAPAAWFVILLVLNIASTAKWIAFPGELPIYLWPWDNGCFAAITMAGILCAQLSMNAAETPHRSRILWVTGFGISLLAVGWLFSPLGISKIRATPSWALFSVGAAVLLFELVHWIADVRGRQRWAGFTKAAGENTLLTYLLPDIFYFAVGASWLPAATRWGLIGAAKSAVFTLFMLALATLLTKRRVRLAL